jgi:hypothetical protein
MRLLLGICALSFAIGHGVANGQSDSQSKSAGPSTKATESAGLPNSEETPEQLKARGRAWFGRCMQDWDAGTHMSKKDWERTCRRLALDRTKFVTKFLMEQPK